MFCNIFLYICFSTWPKHWSPGGTPRLQSYHWVRTPEGVTWHPVFSDASRDRGGSGWGSASLVATSSLCPAPISWASGSLQFNELHMMWVFSFLLHLCSGYWDLWGRGGFKGEEKLIFVCFLPRLEGKWQALMGWLAAFLVHFCFLIQRFGGTPAVTDGRGESFPSGRIRGRIYFSNTLQWPRGRGCGWRQVSPGLCSIREDISWDVQEAWGWPETGSAEPLPPGCWALGLSRPCDIGEGSVLPCPTNLHKNLKL